MISMPKDDLRHTGHIGFNGVTFGDISFIGPEPVTEILKNKSGRTLLYSFTAAICLVERQKFDAHTAHTHCYPFRVGMWAWCVIVLG